MSGWVTLLLAERFSEIHLIAIYHEDTMVSHQLLDILCGIFPKKALSHTIKRMLHSGYPEVGFRW